MRLEVVFPDQLYGEAQKAAAHSGISLDRFVLEAVKLHVQDEEEFVLSPEQIEGLKTAQAEIARGEGIPFETVKADLLSSREGWIKSNPI